MHFGDRPAAAGLEVAKKKVAELGRNIDSQTADIIMRGYVDDGLGGGEEYVVKKLIGEELFDTVDVLNMEETDDPQPKEKLVDESATSATSEGVS